MWVYFAIIKMFNCKDKIQVNFTSFIIFSIFLTNEFVNFHLCLEGM